jgi:hypothetical protein
MTPTESVVMKLVQKRWAKAQSGDIQWSECMISISAVESAFWTLRTYINTPEHQLIQECIKDFSFLFLVANQMWSVNHGGA